MGGRLKVPWEKDVEDWMGVREWDEQQMIDRCRPTCSFKAAMLSNGCILYKQIEGRNHCKVLYSPACQLNSFEPQHRHNFVFLRRLNFVYVHVRRIECWWNQSRQKCDGHGNVVTLGYPMICTALLATMLPRTWKYLEHVLGWQVWSWQRSGGKTIPSHGL